MVTPISNGQNALVGAATQEQSQRQQIERVLRQAAPSDAVSHKATSAEELVEPIKRINETLRPYALQFDLENDHAQVITRIVDMETGEQIRQIPSEEVLRIAEQLGDIQGLLVQQQV